MDVTRAAVLPPLRPAASRWNLAIVSLAALFAIAFFAHTALPYLTLDETVLTRYMPVRPWIILHVATGAVPLLIGPLQVWLGITRRARGLHRRLGLVYVTSIGVSAIAAFYLAANTTLGWVFGTGITGLGIAWIVTTTLAVVAIRRGLIEQHKEWMIRSYVVTFGFVTFRALIVAFTVAGVGTQHERFGASAWFCWAVPLLVTEAALQSRNMFGTRRLNLSSNRP